MVGKWHGAYLYNDDLAMLSDNLRLLNNLLDPPYLAPACSWCKAFILNTIPAPQNVKKSSDQIAVVQICCGTRLAAARCHDQRLFATNEELSACAALPRSADAGSAAYVDRKTRR